GAGAAGAAGGDGSQSSGGNFTVPVGDIGPGLPYGGLLPPTALSFGETIERPLYEALLEDEEPAANGLPTIGELASFALDEEGLLGGNAGDSYASGDLPGENISGSGFLGLNFGSDGPHASAAVVLSAPDATWTQTTNITGTLLADDGTWQVVVEADGK